MNETKLGIVTGDNGCHSPYDLKHYIKGQAMPIPAEEFDALVKQGTVTISTAEDMARIENEKKAAEKKTMQEKSTDEKK